MAESYYLHKIHHLFCNLSEELNKIDQQFGVEIDVRDKYNTIEIAHDPFIIH